MHKRHSNDSKLRYSIAGNKRQTFFQGQGHDEDLTHSVAEAPVEEAPLLTDAQVTSARAFMRNTYARESIALLRIRFGLTEGQQVDRDLVLAVAQYQDTNDLVVDGKLGETTFNTIQAEGGEVMRDVVMFAVMSPLGGRMQVNGGPGVTIFLDSSQLRYICRQAKIAANTSTASLFVAGWKCWRQALTLPDQ